MSTYALSHVALSHIREFPSSHLPWLNKNTDNIRFVKVTDDHKILIEDSAKMVDQSNKTKL
ncbi:MAG: hypothetical protein M3Y53_01095 [Thermoproteota archaeon]|nr:hypothetical protein [Thermoproteota archaeon]